MRTKFYNFKLLLAGFLLFAISMNHARACVDLTPSVTVHCDIDTTNWTDLVLTISNFNLYGGTPNDFCSCAVTSWTTIFSNIQYVAFVDSATLNPVAGFDPWTPSSNASNAWESVLATGNWSGFVSDVNAAGLLPGAPISLIIRAQTPPGYTFSAIDSGLVSSTVGTDEWDDANQTLANSHQNVVDFWTGGAIQYTDRDTSWFTDFDNDFLTGMATLPQRAAGFTVFPTPSKQFANLKFKDVTAEVESIQVFSMTGRLVLTVPQAALAADEIRLDLADLQNGVYLVVAKSDKGAGSQRLVVME